MKKLLVVVGDKFGWYEVVEDLGYFRTEKRQPYHAVRCRCKCGTERIISLGNLRNGNSKSCGCRKRKVGRGSPEHLTWRGMIARCSNPKSTGYERYGGAGIRVCERWLVFENFLEDMGRRPADHTLDRVDNRGDYTPENCRWATWRQQCNNRKNNTPITHGSHTMTVAEWARHLGMKHVTLKNRFRLGWTVDKAFETPVREVDAALKVKMLEMIKAGESRNVILATTGLSRGSYYKALRA